MVQSNRNRTAIFVVREEKREGAGTETRCWRIKRSMLVSFRHRDTILCCETVVCLFVKSGYRRYRSFVLEIPCSPLLAHKGPVMQTINDYPLERTFAILKWPLELSNDTML